MDISQYDEEQPEDLTPELIEQVQEGVRESEEGTTVHRGSYSEILESQEQDLDRKHEAFEKGLYHAKGSLGNFKLSPDQPMEVPLKDKPGGKTIGTARLTVSSDGEVWATADISIHSPDERPETAYKLSILNKFSAGPALSLFENSIPPRPPEVSGLKSFLRDMYNQPIEDPKPELTANMGYVEPQFIDKAGQPFLYKKQSASEEDRIKIGMPTDIPPDLLQKYFDKTITGEEFSAKVLESRKANNGHPTDWEIYIESSALLTGEPTMPIPPRSMTEELMHLFMTAKQRGMTQELSDSLDKQCMNVLSPEIPGSYTRQNYIDALRQVAAALRLFDEGEQPYLNWQLVKSSVEKTAWGLYQRDLKVVADELYAINNPAVKKQVLGAFGPEAEAEYRAALEAMSKDDNCTDNPPNECSA